MKQQIERRMQKLLDKLGIPLEVAWAPNPNHNKHGLIEQSSKTMFLFDAEEDDAWQTFTHEVLEWRFKHVCHAYRAIINSLIEILDTVVYREKEQFLELIPQILRLVEEEKRIEQR